MKNLVIIVSIALIAVVLGVMIFGQAEEEHDIEALRAVATDWMENNAETYLFDGSGLELVEEREVDKGVFEFVFSFESSAAGYGDREDEFLAQVITPHTTVVTVKDGEVVSVITDEIYSEMDGMMLEDMHTDENDEETVSLYFVVVVDGQEELAAVERVVSPGDQSIEAATLEALLLGPTDEEKEMGYSSAINEGVEVNGFSISEGEAYADFTFELQDGVAGSATVMAIRGQIEETLKQFDTIEEVVISVEGMTEDVLQP